ncbi:gag-pol polyprotein [Tanacetum coccineum]
MAYLKLHEVPWNENRIYDGMVQSPNNDPLALVSAPQFCCDLNRLSIQVSLNHYRTISLWTISNGTTQESSSTENLIENVVEDTMRIIKEKTFQEKQLHKSKMDVAGNVGGQNRGGIINPGQEIPIKCYNCNGLGHITRECPRPKRLQDSDYFKDKMLLMAQAQECGASVWM